MSTVIHSRIFKLENPTDIDTKWVKWEIYEGSEYRGFITRSYLSQSFYSPRMGQSYPTQQEAVAAELGLRR